MSGNGEDFSLDEPGEDPAVVQLADKRSEKARAALAGAESLPPSRLWSGYKSGAQSGLGPGEWEAEADELGLPPFCPVTPLGRDGDVFHFLNVGGGLSKLTADKAGKTQMNALFAGAIEFLEWAFPRFDKEGHHVRHNYANEYAQKVLFTAAHRVGAWDPSDKVRGRGVWRADDGTMIVHLGDKVSSKAGMLQPGVYGEYVYPWRAPLPRPADGEVPARSKTGATILNTLHRWNWGRGEVDAHLMLGWIACALIGGWLGWRPNVFVTGDRATGKSSLMDFVEDLLGDWVLRSEDATAAGISQTLKHDSLAVAVDEMEQEAGNTKAQGVIELARRASSAGRKHRGSPGQESFQFLTRSCFLFSGIAPPAMRGQDMSRLAILELRALTKVVARPNPEKGESAQLGRELLRRLIGWAGQMDDLIDLFVDALTDAGHRSRAPVQFGTLAAGAWAALHDDMPMKDDLELWAEWLAPQNLTETQARPAWLACFEHLLHADIDALRHKEADTVATILHAFRRGETGEGGLSFDGARIQLAKAGLSLRTLDNRDPRDWRHVWLFVPNSNTKVNKLFEGTDWSGNAGADGTWRFVLKQAPSEWLVSNAQGRVAGTKAKGVMLFLSEIFEKEYGKEDWETDGGAEGNDDGH